MPDDVETQADGDQASKPFVGSSQDIDGMELGAFYC